MTEIRDAADDEQLLAQGITSPGPLLLFEGQTKSTQTHDGRAEPMSANYAPTWIGAIAAITESPLPLNVYADGPCRVAIIPRQQFIDLSLRYPTVHQKVMHVIGPVMRGVNAREANRERLTSLGTMAAGLAHELNNPAAAARARGVRPRRRGRDHQPRAARLRGERHRAHRRGEAAQAAAGGARDVHGARVARRARRVRRRGRDARRARGPRHRGRLALRRAARGVRPRRGLGRPRAGHRRPGDGEDPRVGGGLADGARAGDRARRVHRAHVRPGQGDQDLRLHGPRRRRPGRRPRRHREHAGDARPQAQAHADQGQARLRQDVAAADDVRLRAQPGLDEPARQRDRRRWARTARSRSRPAPTTAASRSTSPTTVRASPKRRARTSSTRSSPPRPRAAARAWAWTPRGASSNSATAVRSRSTPGKAAPSSTSGSPSME